MNRIELKARAKGYMHHAKPSPVLVAIVYIILVAVMSFLSYKLVSEPIEDAMSKYFEPYMDFDFNLNEYDRFSYNYDFEKMLDPEGFANAILEAMPGPTAAFLDLLIQILSVIVGAGFTIFCLNTVRGREASVWNLLDGFSMFLRIIWLHILEVIFIFLWSLLLIIPGIIAAYRYRMALYLLVEHPEMSAMDCINESKRLMVGHKWELFVVDLSFLGWAILVGFVNGIGSAMGIILLGQLINIWFVPFYQLTLAEYYTQRSAEAPRQHSWDPVF